MQSKATTVAKYLAELPADRRASVKRVREVILKNLPAGFEEGMQYGMIGYSVPHSRYPAGYHADPKQPVPFAALASQKNHLSLYLLGLSTGTSHSEASWFDEAWAKSGKKLRRGKACIRFKHVDDLALDVVGEAISRISLEEFIRRYEQGALSRTPKQRAR